MLVEDVRVHVVAVRVLFQALRVLVCESRKGACLGHDSGHATS